MSSGVGPVKKATPGIKRPPNPQPPSAKAAMNRSVSTGSVAGKPAAKASVYDMFSTSEDEDNNAAAFRSATSSARNTTPSLTRRFSGETEVP